MVPVMIIVHNVIWWLSYHPEQIAPAMDTWFWIIQYISYFILLIPVTAGAALFFYFRQHNTDKHLPKFSAVLIRAVVLCVIGFTMNVLAFGSAALWNWNVVQFFSLSMLVTYAVLRFGYHWQLFCLGAGALFFAPALREYFIGYTDNYIVAIIIGEPSSTHLWPFLPWFAVIVLGFWLAKISYGKPNQTRIASSLVAIGAGCMLLSAIAGKLLLEIDFTNLWGERVFQPPTGRMIGTIGVGLVSFGIVQLFFRNIKSVQYGIITAFSFGLLYIYVFHMIVGHRTQQLLLQTNDAMIWLWVSIALQILMAYGVGVLVLYGRYRTRT